MNEQSQSLAFKTSQPFSHRFDLDNAHNLEAISEKIGVIGYRTRGILTFVLHHMLDNGNSETSHVTAAIETVIDEIKDLEEIKILFDSAIREMPATLKTHSDVLGGDQC
jgi:hypothetical protein